jgi:conjugative transfer region protein (TIGR03750 family)
MNEWSKNQHSINQTLEKLDNNPNVVMGLTGDELFVIALSLQAVSLVTLFPLITLVTGIWILGLGGSMVIGIALIAVVGKKISKLKEREGGAGDIVWINLKIKVAKLLGSKPDVMVDKETWSCDRSK